MTGITQVTHRLSVVGSRAVTLLSALVLYPGVVVAGALALYIVLVILDANPGNAIVTFVRGLADHLIGPFQLLFAPGDPKMRIAVNYGLAAAAYLLAAALLAHVIRLVGDRLAR